MSVGGGEIMLDAMNDPEYPKNPLTSREVIAWFESGHLTSDKAVRYLAQLDTRGGPNTNPFQRTATHFNGESRHKRVESVLRELDDLVGLKEVKQMVHEIRAYVEVQQRRQQLGLVSASQTLHMIFSGAPGTGKTTVARIIGRLFQALDVLPKGHMLEVERADLVGEYIGHTAQKTREVIKRALGGVMFVDEAYSLARGGEKDFGKEAIDTLVKAMEDHRDEFLLILAGYPDEMAWFLSTNPGLLSRFPIHMHFPDYAAAELMAIARSMLLERQYHLTTEADRQLAEFLTRSHGHWHTNAGNARLVRNIIERAIRRQAVRLVSHIDSTSRDDLMTLTWADVEGGW
ncbi:AAA family ATPase [Sulfobacillus thermosulfidooxidans]|uniref:AAA family ATPase n=1 Tax=Sulfobacillus thermosulfidooxidans TaxID=28034 RepID=UPI003D6D5066